jgi:hypothetical protein
MNWGMPIVPTPPMSNTERQRQFRERNPGYYARIKARERAAAKAGILKALAARAAASADNAGGPAAVPPAEAGATA